jgi:uncharacterized membrane protein YfcA
MELLGYLGALLVGLSLGILGAGGSIIAIPVLIYLFKIEPLQATTYSFFIIGSTALIGAVQHIRERTVQIWPALYFAISGVISIYSIRTFIIPLIPENLFSIDGIIITKNIFILIFFAIIMAISGVSMILSGRAREPEDENARMPSLPYLMLFGLGVGIIIAFAGVGGGFLITPTLILFARLPIKKAIGTSLCIISLNSFVGFFSSLQLHPEIHWKFLLVFILVTTTGILGGAYFANRVNNVKLKIIFGWFVLLMAVFIIVNEFYLKN